MIPPTYLFSPRDCGKVPKELGRFLAIADVRPHTPPSALMARRDHETKPFQGSFSVRAVRKIRSENAGFVTENYVSCRFCYYGLSK